MLVCQVALLLPLQPLPSAKQLPGVDVVLPRNRRGHPDGPLHETALAGVVLAADRRRGVSHRAVCHLGTPGVAVAGASSLAHVRAAPDVGCGAVNHRVKVRVRVEVAALQRACHLAGRGIADRRALHRTRRDGVIPGLLVRVELRDSLPVVSLIGQVGHLLRAGHEALRIGDSPLRDVARFDGVGAAAHTSISQMW